MNRTLSHTAIYTIGVVIQNITSLVMLPIYTRYLAPADYGTVELLNMILDVTLIIFGMRVDSGLFRYYHAYEDQERRNAVVATTFFMTLGLNGVGALSLVIFSPQLASAFMGDGQLWNYLAIYSLCLLAPALVAVPYSYVRLLGRPGLFLTLSITKLFMQVALNVLFVVVMELKALGVIYSTIISQLVLGSLFSAVMLKRVGWRFDWSIGRKLFGFSLPLVISSLASFYVVFGDRFFLRKSWGLAAVGLYGLAYRFGFAFWSLTYDPFKKAWDVQKYEILKQPDAKQTYRQVFSLVSKGLIIGALGVSLFISDFLKLFVGPAYQAAAMLVPIILAAFVVRPLTDFCNFGLLLGEKTRHLAQASWLAAAVMTVGYLTLIPPFGATGAAVTAFVGFTTELIWVNHTATRYYDMELDWKRFVLSAAIAVCAFLIALPFMTTSLTAIACKAGIGLAAILAIIFSPAMTVGERQLIGGYAMKIAARLQRRA